VNVPRRHTPYFHKFRELGAELADRIGFDAAVEFTSTRDEHLATRTAVGVYDVYYQGPLDVKGPDAARLLTTLAARDVERRMADEGQVLYTSLCNEGGGIVDDLTVYRLGPEHFWVVATPARAAVVEEWLVGHARGMAAYVTNVVSGTAYLSVQGPRSRELLSGLTATDLSNDALPYFRFVRADVAEVPMVLSRTGYSGELGYELYYPRDYAEHVWDAVLEVGRPLGAVPAGLGALRSVRIEKRYPLYGLDLDETTSPIEAGLGWAVDLDREDFVGADVLRRQRDEGVTRTLVGLSFQDLSPLAKPGDAVLADGQQVGTVTSADRGYAVERSLALAYVRPDVARRDAELRVAGDETWPVTVSLEPFYDPKGERVRS
jgi:glycine cleavage system T protein (aminomethyltransferase)